VLGCAQDDESLSGLAEFGLVELCPMKNGFPVQLREGESFSTTSFLSFELLRNSAVLRIVAGLLALADVRMSCSSIAKHGKLVNKNHVVKKSDIKNNDRWRRGILIP